MIHTLSENTYLKEIALQLLSPFYELISNTFLQPNLEETISPFILRMNVLFLMEEPTNWYSAPGFNLSFHFSLFSFRYYQKIFRTKPNLLFEVIRPTAMLYIINTYKKANNFPEGNYIWRRLCFFWGIQRNTSLFHKGSFVGLFFQFSLKLFHILINYVCIVIRSLSWNCTFQNYLCG